MAVGDLLFAFDPSKESPASVKKKRAIAEAILATNRAPRTIGEGLNALGDGIVANVMNRRASEAEGMGQQSAQKAIAALIAGSDFGGSSGSSASGFAAEAPSIQPDYASQRVAQAHNESGGSDWLKYANQGATRNMPLSGELTEALSFLPELGVQMEVFSGGQPAKGSGGARVGSTRHDHGNAADVFFYKDGRRLDWTNPDDVPIYEEIVRRGRAAGITGFGAGEGYMRPGSMHIGFGGEAVWGAGGKGANAPDWLRNAYNSPMQASNPVQAINGIMNDGPVQVAESEADVQAMEAAMAQQNPQAFNMPTGGTAPQQPVQVAQASMPNQMSDAEALRLLGARAEPQPMRQAPQPMQMQSSGPTMEQLLQASQNPWLSESQRGIVNMLLQQQMQQNDPRYGMQLEADRLGLEKSRFEIDALRNPQPGHRVLSPQEAQSYGLTPDKTYQISKDGKISQVGGSMVEVNMGSNSSKFVEESDKAAATRMNDYVVQGAQAGQMMSDMQQLIDLGAIIGTGREAELKAALGPYAQMLGVEIEGLGEAQAYKSITDRLAPQMRPVGAGSSSDRDVMQYLNSLPQLRNTPEGNTIIANTMRGLAQNKMQAAEIAAQAQMGEITWQEAEKQIRALPNPYENFKQFMKQSGPRGKTSGGIQWSIEE